MTTTSKPSLRKLAKAIADFTRNTYFDGLPIQALSGIVQEHGFDASELDGIYCGRDGRHLARISPKAGLFMTWHKMEVTGRYEVVAYVS